MKKIRERRLDEAGIVNQEVWWINKDEVRAAMKRMKSGKAAGPHDISVEVWRMEMFRRDGSGVFN